MRDPNASILFRTILAAISGSALSLAVLPPAAAETVVPVAPFESVTLHGGGTVTLRHGTTQRVTLRQGTTQDTRVTVVDGWLVIERREGARHEEDELAVEVVTPEALDLAVTGGGVIQSVGSFPRQGSIGVHVENGGTIDIRSMKVEAVAARVQSGGRILAKPQESLAAHVSQGGVVTYWGAPNVHSRVEQGGVVGRGVAADAGRPLAELGPDFETIPPMPPTPPVPPVPPVPPAPPVPRTGRVL